VFDCTLSFKTLQCYFVPVRAVLVLRTLARPDTLVLPVWMFAFIRHWRSCTRCMSRLHQPTTPVGFSFTMQCYHVALIPVFIRPWSTR